MESIPYIQCVFDFDEPENPAEKYCPRCQQKRLIAEFSTQQSAPDGLQFYCKRCQSKMGTSTYKTRRERGLCIKCLAPTEQQRSLCNTCRTQMNQERRKNGAGRSATKRYMDKLRDEVFAIYGGICIVCGESHPAFLSVDHVNDDGAEQRRSTGNGRRFYQWLKKHGFPKEGFQLLCANCNWRKHVGRKQGEPSYHQIWYAHLRQEVILAYGGTCVCCSESQSDVLTIDHVHNDGAEHRREIGRGAATLYTWLRKQGFPQDGRFQLLCFNCNRARFYYGACPHQR